MKNIITLILVITQLFFVCSCSEKKRNTQLIPVVLEEEEVNFLKKDLEDIYYSSYFAEVAEYFTMEGQDERNILNLLFVTFLAMKKKLISLSLIRRIYELKILQFAGFGLQSFQCVHCGNEEHLTRISFEEGGMLCSGCAVKGQGREVESAVLYVLQYVSSIPLNRLYSFTLKENIDKEFEWIVKRYFAVQAGHRFKSAEMLECV